MKIYIRKFTAAVIVATCLIISVIPSVSVAKELQIDNSIGKENCSLIEYDENRNNQVEASTVTDNSSDMCAVVPSIDNAEQEDLERNEIEIEEAEDVEKIEDVEETDDIVEDESVSQAIINCEGETEYISEDEDVDRRIDIADSIEELDEVMSKEVLHGSVCKSLIVYSASELTFSDEAIISIVNYDEYYVITYDSEESAKVAFDTFTSQGVWVEYNSSIDKPEDVKQSDLELVEMISDEVVVVKDSADTAVERKITVAVLDTGIADVSDDELLKGMVVDGYSVIGDSVYDDNGHGTVMANIIARTFQNIELDRNTEAKIMPIKVLDEHGNGSVLSVYMGMEYALAHGADVINLSISGVGNSNILTNEINKAYNQGVTTVVAAGNNSDDVADYIPGNIDTALTISAVDLNNDINNTDGKGFMGYSNHGSFVDFSAAGTYEMKYTDDSGKESVAYINGTSVSSAYVSSYVAMLKAIGDDNVSETDIYESLKAAAIDLGEAGYDEYYGFGYLEKENIKGLNEHISDDKKAIDTEMVKTDVYGEDENQIIGSAEAWFYSGGTYYLDGGEWGVTGWGAYWNPQQTTSNYNFTSSAAEALISFVRATEIFNVTNVTLVIRTGSIYLNDDMPFVDVCGGKTITFKSADGVRARLIRSGNRIDVGNGNNETPSMIFINYPDTTLTFENIDFVDNHETPVSFNSSGGCLGSKGSLNLINCGFASRAHWWSITVGDGGSLNAAGCTFYNDKQYRTGGYGYNLGALAVDGNLNLDGCTFIGRNNNGVDNRGISRAITLGAKTQFCNISNCKITGYGGLNPAIETRDVTDPANITITNTLVDGMGTGKQIELHNNAQRLSVNSGTQIKNGEIGISNLGGNVLISGGSISQNKGQGVYNAGQLDMKSGSISSNGIGVYNSGTFLQFGGSVNDNNADGIDNDTGNYAIAGGEVSGNGGSGIYNRSGNADINGGVIRNNESGINNKGITIINNGTISNNRQDGIKNGDQKSNTKGSLIINDGFIENNSVNGVLNENGKVEIKGGVNKGNKQYGYRNESELTYSAGICGENGFYDVYQNGDYKMSGEARAHSNGVYLTQGHTINITSPLTCEDGAIKVTIEENSRNGFSNIQVGRQVAYCSYAMNKNNADAMLRKLVLLNTRTATKTSYVMKNGYKNRVAALRSGNGTNGAVGNIILSEEYYVSFDKNINNSKVTADVPGVQTHYWKEDANVYCGSVNLYYDGKKFNSLVHNGWNKSASLNADGCGVNGWITYPANEMTSDKVVYAAYTGGTVDLNINGNNQTAGENYTLYNFESNKDLLPENTFERKYEEMIYDVNLEHDELSRRIYSHEGWHLSDNATYDDDPYRYNQKVDFTGLIYEQLNTDTMIVGDDGNANITIYSVWDEPPMITAKNWWISTKQVDDGIFTDENILKRASAVDKEDGTDLKLEVVYPVSKDYYYTLGRTGVWKKGKATVTIVATDSRGNETRKLLFVGVHKDGMIESSWADESKGELPRYVRSISRKYYDMKDTDAGLGKYSVWYVVPTYKKTILDAFYRLENDQPIMTYEFNCADIRKSQEHCFTAIKNQAWLTKEHYDECVEMYKDNKIYDSGYRSSQALCSNRNMNWYKDKEIPEEWFDYSNGITDANLQGWVGYYKAINPSFSELQYIEE